MHRPSAYGLLRYQLDQRTAAGRTLKPLAQQFDFVYAANLDHMDKAIAVLGSPSLPAPFGGMVMRPRFHMASMGLTDCQTAPRSLLAAASFGRLLGAKGVACVTTADPTLAEFCEHQKSASYRKVRYIPEIGMAPSAIAANVAKASFGFYSSDHVILIYGSITRRKAIAECLRAMNRDGKHSRFKVLVVGQPDAQMAHEIASPEIQEAVGSGQLVVRPWFASAETENAAFAAADAVWVAYKNHSTMSGVFYQAVCSERPIIAPNYGVLKWLTEKCNVGICVDPENHERTGDQITSLLQDRIGYSSLQRNERRIAAEHHPESFGKNVCDEILRRTRRSGSQPGLGASGA
jgi:glycosyltransferase involved in cell wall biosynthesis